MNMMNIPDKLTFRRSEVIKITRLDGKVIDYWEKEFGVFVPVVNRMGEKFYTRKDVESILNIKQWLIEEKVEKSKIKEMLQVEQKEEISAGTNDDDILKTQTGQVQIEKLKIIRQNLQEILTILDKNDKRYSSNK